MKLYRLTINQKRGIVERWYRGQYKNSSFRGSPFAFERIISEHTEFTLRTKKSRTTGFCLDEILTQQIENEKTIHLCDYENYQHRLT